MERHVLYRNVKTDLPYLFLFINCETADRCKFFLEKLNFGCHLVNIYM